VSRPKPRILLEVTNKKTFKTDQVLEADAIWAVFFQNKPVNLKNISVIACHSGTKYKKISFSNPGHAFNLADKLNKQFGTTEFTVVKLTSGETLKNASQD